MSKKSDATGIKAITRAKKNRATIISKKSPTFPSAEPLVVIETMIKEAIIKIIVTFFIPYFGYSQDLKTVFLDSIDMNHFIVKSIVVDTVIMNSEYSIRINYNDEITVFGNLDKKNRPSGKWIFTFSQDQFEYVKGSFYKGKRDGIWYIDCGARKTYEKGKAKKVTMCPF